jgi:transposase-like protein
VPRVIITDKLRSYGAAQKELLAREEHCQQKRLNYLPLKIMLTIPAKVRELNRLQIRPGVDIIHH